MGCLTDTFSNVDRKLKLYLMKWKVIELCDEDSHCGSSVEMPRKRYAESVHRLKNLPTMSKESSQRANEPRSSPMPVGYTQHLRHELCWLIALYDSCHLTRMDKVIGFGFMVLLSLIFRSCSVCLLWVFETTSIQSSLCHRISLIQDFFLNLLWI